MVKISKCHKPDFLQATDYVYTYIYLLNNPQTKNSDFWQFKMIMIFNQRPFLEYCKEAFPGDPPVLTDFVKYFCS